MLDSRNDLRVSDGADTSSFDKVVNYGRRLFQPKYWPQLRRLALHRLTRRPLDRDQIRRVRQICTELSYSPEDAAGALDLPPSTFRSFAADHPARLEAAQRRIDAVHVGRMGGGADVDLLYSLCIAIGATRIIETGVAYGWSSLAILSAIETQSEARLISIDMPYLGANLDGLVGLAVPAELRSRWTLRRGADRDELESAVAEMRPLDLVHYDSDKSERGRRWAYPLMWDGLRPGGLMMSDDIEDNRAFLDFCESIGQQPIIARAADGNKFSGILRKSD